MKHFRLSKTSYLMTWLVIGFLIRIHKFDDSIYERFSFRQTQTAFGIRSLSTESLNPFEAQVPVLGPPWKIPFEFPLYQFLAALITRFFSLNESTSGRLLSTIFFLLAALFIFLILEKTHSEIFARTSTPLFILTSFSLQWGSAVLIDWQAMALTLFAIYLLILHDSKKKFMSLNLVLALMIISLASLTKITTTLPWILSFSAYIIFKNYQKWTFRNILSQILILFTFLPTVIWNNYADKIKLENPFTRWLTSSNLTEWNYGTLKQRTYPNNWNMIFERIDSSIIGSILFLSVILLISQLFKRSRFSPISFYFLATISAPIIFFNLYQYHDYYLISIYPALIGLVSIILTPFLILLRERTNRNAIIYFPIIITILFTYTSQLGLSYLTDFRTDYGIPSDSILISEQTEVTSNIVVIGCDWDPTLLFFADRKGLMLTPGRFDSDYLTNDLITQFEYVFFCGEQDLSLLPKDIQLSDKGNNLFKIIL